MRVRLSVSMLLSWVAAGCQASPPQNDLVGVWEVQSIEVQSDSGTSLNADPLPGQAIFTGSHYSLVWMPGTESMRAFAQRWTPTDAEKIQRYGEIVVNSGTYTLGSASSVTLTPVVSRVPEFMGGGRILAEYRVAGDTLWYTQIDEYSYDGAQAPWATSGDRVTIRFHRVESVTAN